MRVKRDIEFTYATYKQDVDLDRRKMFWLYLRDGLVFVVLADDVGVIKILKKDTSLQLMISFALPTKQYTRVLLTGRPPPYSLSGQFGPITSTV